MRSVEQKLAEVMASALVEAVNLPRDPHLDVFELARVLGLAVSRNGVGEDGRLERHGDSARVVLSPRVSEERMRFTLAHELGHLLLDDPDVAFAAQAFASQIPNVERFCNVFAAELLMPRVWLRRRFAGRPQAFSTLNAVAEEAKVSRTAALVQLSRHARWSAALLLFDERRRWAPITLAGAPWWAKGAIRPLGETARVVQAVHVRGLSGQIRTIQLQTRRQLLSVRAEFEAVNGGVLALAVLPAAQASGRGNRSIPPGRDASG